MIRARLGYLADSLDTYAVKRSQDSAVLVPVTLRSRVYSTLAVTNSKAESMRSLRREPLKMRISMVA